MFLFTHIFVHSLMHKITVFLALPATVTGRLCLSEENPLEASSISTTAVETVRRTCWKNVGKNVEISINQQVSFNLWPSSTMFWQRLEQLWALLMLMSHFDFDQDLFWINDHRQTNYRFSTDLSNVDVDKPTHSKVGPPRQGNGGVTPNIQFMILIHGAYRPKTSPGGPTL